MNRRTRWMAMMGAALMTVSLVGPASARHDDERSSGYEQRDRHEYDRAHRHHGEPQPVRAVPFWYRWRQPVDHRPRVVVHNHRTFYCKPCNHRFRSRFQLRNHLHHDHHIALWRLPFVIVHRAFGAVFYG